MHHRFRFQPLQTLPLPGTAFYREHLVPADLAVAVYCFWELDWPPGAEQAYPVLPDGCTDLVFSLLPGEPGWVSVTGRQSLWIPFSGRQHFVGARFFPGFFPSWFRHSLSGMEGQSVLLSDVPGLDAEAWEARFQGRTPSEAMLQLAEFLRFIGASMSRSPDPRLMHALHALMQTGGDPTRVAQLDIGLSERQLRRHMESATGLSPKVFARIVRFQEAFRFKHLHPGLPFHAWPDFGYYDQAHFCHEWNQLTAGLPEHWRSLPDTD
jgi:AraC-like DNA-binding protein